MSLSQSVITQWGWGFHIARGEFDPGDLRFRPRVVEGVEIWKGFYPGEISLASPGAAGPRRWPEGQLAPRAGSMNLSQSAITQGNPYLHDRRANKTCTTRKRFENHTSRNPF